MGKLAIISDVHLDINELHESDMHMMVEQLKQENVTHLHIAGDSANTKKQALRFVNFMDASIPTTFHWGNHEMPDLTEVEIETYSDERFLNFRTHKLTEKIWLLGINGWYDYTFAEPLKRDFSRLKKLAWYDRFIHRPYEDPKLMKKLAQQLRKTLQEIPGDVSIIISTHFVTNRHFIRQYTGKYEKWNQMNAYLGSPLFSEVAEEFPQVKQIVFGHAHRRIEQQEVNGILYSSRPLGYYYEWKTTYEWVKENEQKPIQSMAQVKRYLSDHKEAFFKVRQQFLRKEWIEAQTIIDYE